MRHYEVVVMIHPDQSDQVESMVERYRSIVEEDGGSIHRLEDWGRRQLAYSINKMHKAHYILMNIECTIPALKELTDLFKFNDAVIRNQVISMKSAAEGDSAMKLAIEKESSRRDRDDSRSRYDENSKQSSESSTKESPSADKEAPADDKKNSSEETATVESEA
ncbi:MAG: 30S ribosomal protein S6 [Thiotrichales bacterium]|jgi:small subunit ribosomal protein S6|nr:30S ribosomal protein S6 [Thiotrichales bacterium]MBT4261093.1 30S ribosomal protein S6 [Thiotrichales bacterium]MBT4574605.1 30S ribosomal protein S6 [Thiotrichales bacterium]MBT4971816.1 30S ribosomal protein S6 [Thiotrichales bacterium]MBT6616615.1 30S ribosomal protein S6 [Thiotrichales bacterium]